MVVKVRQNQKTGCVPTVGGAYGVPCAGGARGFPKPLDERAKGRRPWNPETGGGLTRPRLSPPCIRERRTHEIWRMSNAGSALLCPPAGDRAGAGGVPQQAPAGRLLSAAYPLGKQTEA